MKLCEINSLKYPILSKEEAIERITDKFYEFIEVLKAALMTVKCEEVNILGLGNSLTAGWSAIDKDVRPFILKLQNILFDSLNKSGIQVNFHNYSIEDNNSNEEILRFILSNPSEVDVKKRFKEDKESWDQLFYNTPFRNYVDSDIAYSFYPETNYQFLDNYSDKALTITHLNGCTGGFLNSLSKSYENKFLHIRKSYYEDLCYLRSILLYIKSLHVSEKNIITVGNFPYISTKLVSVLVNGIISNMNELIKCVSNEEGVYYFNQNQIAFFQEFVNPDTGKLELKLDNHPTIDEQYTVLYHYFNFLIDTLKYKFNNNLLIKSL